MEATREFAKHLREMRDMGIRGCLVDGQCRECERLLPLAEAELAAGAERVVEVRHEKDEFGLEVTRILSPDGDLTTDDIDIILERIFGETAGDGRYATRRLPDAPKPVAVRPWLIRPNAAQPYLVCRYCQWRAEVGAVACGECGKPFLEPEELPEPVVGEGAE